jgi:hypothetical protein
MLRAAPLRQGVAIPRLLPIGCGSSEVWLHPSVEAEARSRAAAITGKFRVEVRKTGRGERDSPATNDLPITMRLSEPPTPLELVRSA